MFKRFALAFSLGLMASSALSSSSFASDRGPLQIYVSKATQTLTVYDGDTVIATTRVSTGKPGHTTPSGIFSILEKRKYHESNLYSNAPMPFMQRLTWSGIALHEGKVPDHPASHGCVRLPNGFAKMLFSMTERGAHVIITDEPVTPQRITHANLFTPRHPIPEGGLLSDAELRPTKIEVSAAPVEVAMNDVLPKTGASAQLVLEDEPPLRILITRRGQREQVRDVQEMLAELGFDVGAFDGVLGSQTLSAIRGYKRWKSMEKDGELLSSAFLTALSTSAGRGKPLDGQLMIRQKFKPIFEAAIAIRDPHKALGTHFLEATHVDRFKGMVEWQSVSIDDRLPAPMLKRLGITEPADQASGFTAEAALSRLDIPDDVRAKIDVMLSEGSSITISDSGIGPETGKGTDFITLTKAQAKT